VVVDATGVGMPVVEMLRAADLKAMVVPVMITGGATAHRSEGVWFVPRREGGHLVEEMTNVRWDARAYAGA